MREAYLHSVLCYCATTIWLVSCAMTIRPAMCGRAQPAAEEAWKQGVMCGCRAASEGMTKPCAACRTLPCTCARHATTPTSSWTLATSLHTLKSSSELRASWSCWTTFFPNFRQLVRTWTVLVIPQSTLSLTKKVPHKSTLTHKSLLRAKIAIP